MRNTRALSVLIAGVVEVETTEQCLRRELFGWSSSQCDLTISAFTSQLLWLRRYWVSETYNKSLLESLKSTLKVPYDNRI